MSDKNPTIDSLKNLINKKFGNGSLQTFGDDDDVSIQRQPVGIPALDMILGKGSNGYGLPVGRIIEVYGPESQGKTSVALAAVAAVQKAGGVAAYIDAEHSLDLEWATKLGVDINEMMLAQPMSAEQGYDIVEALANSGQVRLIVIDSVPAMLPKKIAESSAEDQFMDKGAGLNSTMMRKLVGPLAKNDCTLILINQTREKVGVMYGNPEITPGGKAIKFYASIRLDIRRTETIKDGGKDIGHTIKACTKKNKTANPFQVAEFKLIWGKGFDVLDGLFHLGRAAEVIHKAGGWYTTEFDEKKMQGSDAVVERMKNEPEFRAFIEEAVGV